jgi:putative iron-dependent peroxidase
MHSAQPGILEPVPSLARYVRLHLVVGANPRDALRALANASDGVRTVVGIGHDTVTAVGAGIPGLHEAPTLAGHGVSMPTSPAGLWLWLRGADRGELLHRSHALESLLAPAFEVDAVTDAFTYDGGRDLTGYMDGTENPKDDAALAAALVSGQGAGLDGSSFVAVQVWRHELARFQAHDAAGRDAIIGRTRDTNEELEDAPASAHVKRTAQESFDPAAFVLRRSMPYAEGRDAGLVFVAFGRSFTAFEALARRMLGLDDGVTDALFRFTRPITTSYAWCPPMSQGRLDLRALGL